MNAFRVTYNDGSSYETNANGTRAEFEAYLMQTGGRVTDENHETGEETTKQIVKVEEITEETTTSAPTVDENQESDPEPVQTEKERRIARYNAKRSARIERLKARAAKTQAESTSRLARARSMASVIPFGQPILVGHYSEGRDRRYRAKIENNYRKGFEAMEKAKEIESRIESAENNDAIYTEDPQAPEKIVSKLEELEALQARYKAINKAHAAYLKNPASLEKADLSEGDKKLIREWNPAYSFEKHPIQPYTLTNLSANIRRLKQRAQVVEKMQTAETTEKDVNGIKIEFAPNENRVRIHFNARVENDIYKKLKQAGFRHAPSQGKFTFSAYYNNWTKQNAEQIAAEVAGNG